MPAVAIAQVRPGTLLPLGNVVSQSVSVSRWNVDGRDEPHGRDTMQVSPPTWTRSQPAVWGSLAPSMCPFLFFRYICT